MQEHIRRAHPDYYIPKLPATEDSFQQMISIVPHRPDRLPTPPTYTQSGMDTVNPQYISLTSDMSGSSYESNKTASSYASNTFYNSAHIPATPRPSNELRRPSIIPAAAALAQLHNSEPKGGWDSEQVCIGIISQQSSLILDRRCFRTSSRITDICKVILEART
jgi:hypothetical protein